MEPIDRKKKLIEVALPLAEINTACGREKSIRHGHPSTLHLWWARRPLAAARAVIFAQMVDDPSEHPERFPTEADQTRERERLFDIIRELVEWENTTNETVLGKARAEIQNNWHLACAANANSPHSKELFDPEKIPVFTDPFAGGGSLPLEAQRLGLEVHASDLNPVAVLINKAMVEIPPRFAGMVPVNPTARTAKELVQRSWRGAQGLAEDVRFYGRWMNDEAEKRIGHLYPRVEITAEMARDRRDLESRVGQSVTVIAWLWARTVRSPDPAFHNADVPLVATYMLSSKAGKEVFIEPVIRDGGYTFTVKLGKPSNFNSAKNGTKLTRGANFQCLLSGTAITGDYIKSEGQSGRMGMRLMAIVAEGGGGRIYLPPTDDAESIARAAQPEWVPEGKIVEDARAFTPYLYGLTKWQDLFTPRQLVALTTLVDLVSEARERARLDAVSAGILEDQQSLESGGRGATAYADAIAVYLGLTASKAARFTTTLSTWRPDETKLSRAFTRNDIPMTWDFAETNPFSGTGGDIAGLADGTASVILTLPAKTDGTACIADATSPQRWDGPPSVICTDPPYYDNVPYADLSDYFYVWLRKSLGSVLPDLFSTLLVPKADELVAATYRHGGKKNAEVFFLNGMTRALHRLVTRQHPEFPVVIYYAFKQSESTTSEGTASTGWETFLEAVISAGLAISGTWPLRTEGKTRMRNMGSNALASSIVLACERQSRNAIVATRREFLSALKVKLIISVAQLQQSNIAPVDLAQSAIGPGMAVYTRYAKILDAEGKTVSVREALALINAVLDDVLSEQEGSFDADSRFAIVWFEETGFSEAEFGIADVLARAKNTSVSRVVGAGLAQSGAGKVRLLRPDELKASWEPHSDPNISLWKIVHHLIRVLEADGESGAASLLSKVTAHAEAARELAYRLYTAAERKKRAPEALSYNGLVQSWPEIVRLSRDMSLPRPIQTDLLGAF